MKHAGFAASSCCVLTAATAWGVRTPGAASAKTAAAIRCYRRLHSSSTAGPLNSQGDPQEPAEPKSSSNSSNKNRSRSKRPHPNRRLLLLSEEITSLSQAEASAFSRELRFRLSPAAAGAPKPTGGAAEAAAVAKARRGPPAPICPFPHPLGLFVGASPVGVFGVRQQTAIPLWQSLLTAAFLAHANPKP